MGNSRIIINTETRHKMVFAGQQDPIKGHFELAFDPKDITNDHHGIIQVNATDPQVGTQGAFSYQIVNILEAQSSIVNVTYFCGANNLNNANSATLVVEQLAVATIFQVSTNLDTAFQLEARELNVHFTITPVAVVAV